jgi:hypothetical protein
MELEVQTARDKAGMYLRNAPSMVKMKSLAGRQRAGRVQERWSEETNDGKVCISIEGLRQLDEFKGVKSEEKVDEVGWIRVDRTFSVDDVFAP